MSDDKLDIEEIFHDALAIAPLAARMEFVNQVCEGNEEKSQQVRELLDAHELASDFLEQTPGRISASSERHRKTSAYPAAVGRTEDQTLPPGQHDSSSPNAKTTERVGQRFGDYELIEEIASGGMGRVHKAKQISLNRTVALKMILSGQFANDDEVDRFYREAAAAAKLDHPGIVPVYDVGAHKGQHFFSMAFVDGESLAAKLKKGAIPSRTAALYIKKVAMAIQVAHEQGIVHRDLKPGNILLDQNDEPRIVDFGLAKHVETDSDLTTTGMVLGTPHYMPPEQASGITGGIGASSDVYSLGAILYSLLTGRPPFIGSNTTEILIQVLQEEPISLRQLKSKIPKDLEAICLKCLEKTSARRYQSAAELADDLERYLSGEPVKAKNDLGRRFRKWSIREPVLAAHLAATFLLMSIIAANYLIFGYLGKNSLQILIVNQAILAIWALAVFALQKIHNVVQGDNLVPTFWAAVNPLFLTATLCANEPPRASLFSLFLLLIVISGFFRRVELVAATTVSSLIGFIVILTMFSANDSSIGPPSYQVVFGLTLLVTGLLLGLQANRLNRLSQKESA